MNSKRRTPEEFYADELREHELAWRSGNHLALINAFNVCLVGQVAVPEWLGEAIMEKLGEAYFKSGGVGRGRTGSPWATDKSNDMHGARWRSVNYWLNNKKLLPYFGYPATVPGAYDMASEELRGTAFQGSRDAMAESYDLVRKAIKIGDAARYGVPPHQGENSAN